MNNKQIIKDSGTMPQNCTKCNNYTTCKSYYGSPVCVLEWCKK